MDEDIVAMGFAAVTEVLVVFGVVVAVVVAVTVVADEGVEVEIGVVDAGVAVAVDDELSAAAVVVVLMILLVLICLIIEFELFEGAAGLNGVFCFCMLYIRLGHNVTRISRPNNSLPSK